MHQKLSRQSGMCYDPVLFVKDQGYTETEESNLPGELRRLHRGGHFEFCFKGLMRFCKTHKETSTKI